MNTSTQHSEPYGNVQSSGDQSRREGALSAWRKSHGIFSGLALLAGLFLFLFSAPTARADIAPPGCNGSGLGITLFTDIPDVHIGDTVYYSINVFNGIPNSGRTVCDATSIQAFIVTPDGHTNVITLVRTTLHQGESDFYPDVVSYVVRAQDILPDGTIRATANDTGIIHQNDVNSVGGGFQGVNTQVSLPCIGITVRCSNGVGENGAINFTGTVTNCGNNTLVGVTVTNFDNGGQFTVNFLTNLLTGQIASFSGSWIPYNPCIASPITLVAQGVDQYTAYPRTVTSSATVTCSEVLTPGIKVTKSCPSQPVSPGQLLTFSGSVSNTGNVTLTNIVVVNNQPAANTPVFTLASLAPGAVANFTGSYTAPTSCSVADTLTATAASRCGVGVSNVASATCPILTTPQIAVTVLCPENNAVPGGTLTYSGTVQNTGNITLTNVVVVSDRPVANTVVFTRATLAPGVSTNFTSSLTVPANACTVTTTFSGTGKDVCTLNAVTNTVSATCQITTAPAIAVTLVCPTATASVGGLITYTGTVRNSGNVILNNVTVVNNQAGTVLTVASLAVGASANFTASFIAPADACSVSSTVTASGNDACTQAVVMNTASATCPLATAPRIVVTRNCPDSPASVGGVLTYSGTVSNAGNITLTNVVVTDAAPGSTPPVVATIWVDDALPSGAVPGSNIYLGGDSWNWVSNNPAPYSGSKAHQSNISAGEHQHFFVSASPAFAINTGDILVAYVYLDPTNIPSEIMLQWSDGAWEHRAYWGSNLIAWGTDGTAGRRFMGALPASGQWVRLEVPASVVGLEGHSLNGMAFTLFGGRATWDAAGKQAATPTNNPPVITTIFTTTTLAPGAVTNFTGADTVPVNSGCTITSSLTASAQDKCTGIQVANSVTTTCPVLGAPSIAVTLACPVTPTSLGGLLTFSGTVSNAGNVTVTNVVVTREPSTVIFSVARLTPGSSANFTGSYTVPGSNVCSITTAVSASANELCAGSVVSARSTIDCPLVAAPRILVTQTCSVNPGTPGGVVIYGGSVSNAGNITLTNIIVVSSQPTPNTVVFTQDLLAPGATASFSSSFNAPLDACSATSVLTATGQNQCNGNTVNNSVTTTCPLVVAPQITVTKACPITPAIEGGLLVFTGTVTNTGNITLTNIFVVNNGPVANAAVLGPITLAPGAGASFSGSYTAPLNACSVTDTLTATGRDKCYGGTVTNAMSATCPITTIPRIAVTLACPAVPASAGGLITYTGFVTNSGNVTLNNVTVVDNQASPSTVLTVPSLAPHTSTNFTASFIAPNDACTVSSTVTAIGSDNCTQLLVTNTASATCALLTTAGIQVTKACPAQPAVSGQLLTFSGSVSNTGTVTLMNIVVVNNQPVPNTAIFTAASLAPGAITNFTGSYIAPLNCSVTDTLTATATNRCGMAVTNSASATCAIATTPAIVVTQICPATSVLPGGILTYSGTVSNAGNITLTNIVVTDNRPTANTVVFTMASLAPGATASFSGSYQVPIDCCVVWSTVTASGQGCYKDIVTDSVTRTCTVQTSPRIVVTKVCAPGVLRPGDLLTYSGIVSNAGNITLINVTVTNNQSPNNPLLVGPISLAPGESVSYYASYIVPPDFCGGDTVTASGLDVCTYLPVMNSVTVTCPVTLTPRIVVTKDCPAEITPRGGLYTYTGSVSNAGDVTLVNVVVTNRYKFDCYTRTNGWVIGPITLAPGASASFSGSYTAPWSCCEVVDTLTASGQDRCAGSNVTATATTVCPLLTTPGIAVVQNCPLNPIPIGSLYQFSGYVTNTGDAVLTNVFVFNSQSYVPVLGPIELAPGESQPYSGSYLVPTNTCSVSVTVFGQDICGGIVVTNTASCPVAATTAITVTETCPPGPVTAGTSVLYGGSVSNSGSITLTNVLVFSSSSNSTLVLGPITLDPGASAPFVGSYIATGGSNLTTNSTIVTNGSTYITTNTTFVIVTNTTITITTNQPTPVSFGTIDSVSQLVVDRFLIGSNFNGLTYAGEDHGYGATEFYSMRKADTGTSFFDTIIASTATPTDRFDASTRNFDALAYASPDLGYGPVIFYYLSHDNAGVSTFGSITPGGTVGVTTDHFVVGNNFDALTFAATDVGYGVNLFYYVRHDANGISTFGTISPGLPGVITDRFIVGTNVDALVFTDLTAPGYGADNFYYLRHDANRVSTFGTIQVTGPTTATVTDRFTVGTNAMALTFTATDAGSFGPDLFYFLRGRGLYLTTNIVTTYTINTVITLTTNTATSYTTNIVVTFTPTNTVTASGMDTCEGSTVTAAANCLGPVPGGLPAPMSISAPIVTAGLLKLPFPTVIGKSYTVQYKNKLSDPTWTNLPGMPVPGTGGNLVITDPSIAGHSARYYRIMITQ